MSAQHTPGPWKIILGNADRKFREASIRPVTSPFKGLVFPVASVRYVHESFGQANARLIAAAPDLLKSLQDVMERIVDRHEQHESAISARAAIAKATGETK